MKRKTAMPKKIPGQLVRLTVRDYQLLLEAVRMADAWKGSKMPEDWPEFEEVSNMRWNTLFKIREAVYTRRMKRECPHGVKLDECMVCNDGTDPHIAKESEK